MRKGLSVIAGIAILLFAYSASAAVVTDGLTHWWKFDETSGANAADEEGNHDLTLYGYGADATWTNDKAGVGSSGALYFDGTDDRGITTADTTVVTNRYTVEMWVKRENSGVETFLLNKKQRLDFYLSSGNELRFKFLDSTDTWSATHALSGFTNDVWQYVAATFDGTDVKLYLNGVCGYTSNADAGKTFVASARAYELGVYDGVGGGWSWFQGMVDDTRVYSDKALTEAEILGNYDDMAIPEPSTLLFMGAGLLGLAAFRRIKK